ncbi:MAG: type II secretion system GspH family protein [Planctomycetaceae bacterium]|nr:type II secretion system GspH family protein [Planctomycetaceae bacterium]
MNRFRRGFTLVEMLVVIGIIGVLAALLLPAVMAAVNIARRAAIATEIAELHKAIESYRVKHDDYPPNFRDFNAFMRHVRKCYPQVTPAHLNAVIIAVWGSNPPMANVPPAIDEGESLVFWLYLVDNDKREPFKAILSATPLLAAGSSEHLYPFKEERFIDGSDTDVMPAYKAIYSGESAYLYLDSRSYDDLTDYSSTLNAAQALDLPGAGYARPYWSETRATAGALTPPDLRDDYKAMNPTSFQIICAGQDGLFGADATPISLRYFPGGGGYSTSGEDNDNMTNFTEGGRLEDKVP